MPRSNHLKTTLVLTLILPGVAACSSDVHGKSSSPSSSTTKTAPPAAPAKVSIADTKITQGGEITSDLGKYPILVRASGGTLDSVDITDAKGKKADRISLNKVSSGEWRVQGLLDNTARYTVHAVAVNSQGKRSEAKEIVNTFTPSSTNSFTVFPYGNMQVGVGMPVTVTFASPVKDRKTVENKLHVKSSQGEAGSWGWIDDHTVVWRPDNFWKSGSKVDISLDTKGLSMGNGVYGRQTVNTSFKVGRKLEVDVSNATKHASVKINGKEVRNFPVSLGKPGHSTSSGWNIIYEKVSPVRMKGADYDETVYYAQRYTSTGEYLHSAPWSVWAQGNTNVSHGCVNIGPSNAIWLYKTTLLGDVVHITGTHDQADKWDGMGAIWNYSLKDWKALSANHS